MKNYVDYKVTIRKRLHFLDDVDMGIVSDIIKNHNLDTIIDESLGFTESEVLHDTEVKLSTKDNSGRATIEVFQDNNVIWVNS